MLKIALLFHSAKNDNLGVGALSVSEVEILRQIAQVRGLDVQITVIDSFGPRPPYICGNDVQVTMLRPMRHPFTFFRTVRQNDLVIDIGGGDSFADIYGWKRFTKMHLLKYLVHLSGRALVLAPQTIGPFRSRLRQAIAAQSIRMSKIVVTRDALSTAALQTMGVGCRTIEASDVALRLPFTPPAPRAAGTPVRVGLNVSGLLMNGGYTRNNMFGLKMDYGTLIRSLITDFLAHPDGCELHLVPHVISWDRSALEDDYQASLDLAVAFPEVKVAPRFASPSEAKSYIAGLDFFMGARMHACIAAFSAGVPVVPMAYSRKFAGLFGSLGYHHTVDCTAETAAAIQQKIQTAYDGRAALAHDMLAAYDLGLQKLAVYELALGDVMEKIAAAKR